MHSTASDGGYDSVTLMQKCKDAGMTLVSLTDHDTTEAIPAAREKAEALSMLFIEGIELSTAYEGESVDILGYGIDITSESLQKTLSFHRTKRLDRMKQMISKCQEEGMSVTLPEVEQFVTGSTYSRPHLAKLLVEKGYVASVQEAFEHYLGYNKPCYVKKEDEMSPSEACATIHEAGGLAIVAHPVYYKIDSAIYSWLVNGEIDGVEVYHRDHSLDDIERFRHIVESAEQKTGRSFFQTGGTDFHHESFGRDGEVLGESKLPYAHADKLFRTIFASRI
ncbi:PHP domain-containing protein [Paenalkalicoccus suaedae]|uniref:PHP domain-containing protein n=2 Tax=Paenalkalicoccus suaedae TaxID=2592382 RepID=A0A859FKB5_9BACI|nr:PHP domain-containing protein [Paenalkalicoccus suaedae]